MLKREEGFSMRISRKLHEDLECVPEHEEKKMRAEIEDVLMRYAFIYSQDYRARYRVRRYDLPDLSEG
jgi:hypothetical protein